MYKKAPQGAFLCEWMPLPRVWITRLSTGEIVLTRTIESEQPGLHNLDQILNAILFNN